MHAVRFLPSRCRSSNSAPSQAFPPFLGLSHFLLFSHIKSLVIYREKPLTYFHKDAQKGGPIDVYKEFITGHSFFRAGLEFETGNISSAHRSMNKLCVGIKKGELDLAMLMMPTKNMSFYLTDRVSNYEELEPYFLLLDEVPFVVFGFDAEEYSVDAPLLPKGKDGMSPRTIRKWQYK